MASGQPQDLVQYYRTAMAETVQNNTDSSAILTQLLRVDRSLDEKFVHLKFCNILAKNAQSTDNLRRLIMGLNILEKYGRHLLKPSDVRSNMWRHIKFTNSIFRDRVDTIQGGREIMAQMGYSVVKEDGVAFPDGVDPDPGQVLELVVDILLAKRETEAFLSDSHPHPDRIEACLHPDLLRQLGKLSAASAAPDEQNPQTLAAPAGADNQRLMSNSTRSSHSSRSSPNYVTASEGKETDTESEPQNASITCDICGKNYPDFVCAVCDDKRLCQECDMTWHKHPKRQNHPRVPLGSLTALEHSPKVEMRQPPSGGRGVGDGGARGQGTEALAPQLEGQSQRHREPMSLYPSQTGIPSFANMGYSLPPNALGARSSASEHNQQMMLGGRAAAPQNLQQGTSQQQQQQQYSMAGMNPAWAGSSPIVTGSQASQSGSQFESPGALLSMTGARQNIGTVPPTAMMSQPRGIPSSQGASQVNIVNPLQYSQQNAHFPSSPGLRPAQSFSTMGYSAAPTMGAPQMQHYPTSFMPNSMQMFASHDQSRFSYYPTLPPQTLDSRLQGSPYTPSPQEQVRGMENVSSPKTPENLQTPSTGSSTASMSHLLPAIMAIPDLEKRNSRIRVDLMNLQDDIKEWDGRINAIILDNPNFFQDDDYKSLNRKKRRHLQEIKELESYSKELQKLLDERDNDVSPRDIKTKSEEEKQIEVLQKRLSEIKSGGEQPYVYEIPQQQINPQFMYSGMMPAAPGSGMYMPDPGAAGIIPYSVPASNPQINPATVSNQLGYRSPGMQNSNVQGSADDLSDDIKKMLVLDQNPHQFKSSLHKESQPIMNIPVTSIKENDPSSSGISYPPTVTTPLQQANDVVRPKTKSIETTSGSSKSSANFPTVKHIHSEPNMITANSAVPSVETRKIQSAIDMTVWECEHCTFQNDIADKACAICYKTSENPKVIGPSAPLVNNNIGAGELKDEGVICEFCTYKNQPGAKICEVCARTQTSANVTLEEVATEMRNLGDGEECGSWEAVGVAGAGAGSGAGVGDKDAVAAGADHSTVGKLIDEEQDKVFLEKKAAQEKFEKSQSQDPVSVTTTPDKSVPLLLSPAIRPGPKLSPAISPAAPNSPYIYPLLITPEDYDLYPLVAAGDIERIRNKSEHDQSTCSSGSYGSAQTSLEMAATGGAAAAVGNQSGAPEMRPFDPNGGLKEPQGPLKKGRPQLGFAEAIEQISMKREQEQMSVDAHDFVQLIKLAENAGFEIGEIEIAQQRSVQDKMKPIDWLEQKWGDMKERVAKKAAEVGKNADQNDIGDLSEEEAREALVKCEGDVEKAGKMCAELRAEKYAEISGRGPFAREDILTALYQNRGSVEEAQDQLNQAIVQAYLDRVWTDEQDRGGGGDAALAAAARAPDTCNSVSNSVIGHDDFQRLVTDIQINRERRVRMVFVEGKLASWGRADTVITILDQEVTQAQEPLQCCLEDIVEAVRNCGDRKSSLFYLKQECGCCFSLFPMSKINNLTACSCKICHDCIQQNFEVVIREKYVRNWNCPLCNLPDFEDETSASEYFEFLTLILQARVSQEVLELFETKLRDWHLQKDPNFRWCAHCASGFIWDRPQVLGMECPHCRMKTCFQCKKKWEDQHEGLTCEEFTQWCIDNDPEKQAKGVQVYLEQNGIDCPSCKMRYDLAKGGCMHFKCPQCGHEFCSGCYQPFLHDGVCKMFRGCSNRGLHCHHPRDCYYWLRDYAPGDLQKLLKSHKVAFNTDPPPTQADKQHCPVMEQKEYGVQKKDEPCNNDTQKGSAGLCTSHYKEYLVDLINKSRIDPLQVLSLQQMKILVERNERELPKLNQNEPEHAYRKRVMQFIQNNFKIPRR